MNPKQLIENKVGGANRAGMGWLVILREGAGFRKLMVLRKCLKLIIGVLLALIPGWATNADVSLPGWSGTLMIPAPTAGLPGWTMESDAGSSGTLTIGTNALGTNTMQLNWNIGTGNWTQARYDFSVPFDASAADIFGITLHGDVSSVPANTVAIMFADINGVTYGYDWSGQNNGVNQVNRWIYNLSVPKKAFSYYWGGTGGTAINWAKIKNFWLVVKRPGSGLGGGSGTLSMDALQCVVAASWPRATNFVSITQTPATEIASSNAIAFIRSQQNPSTGLFSSWQEDPGHPAWLYDQATALIVMTRDGKWTNGSPINASAMAADNLWDFLRPAQKSGGYWARGWNAITGAELSTVLWVGDQAWMDMALVQYASKSGNAAAKTAAEVNAQSLASLVNSSGGITGFPSTEGTVDTWWAMIATGRFSDADKVASYLLSSNVWDSQLQYWYEGLNNPAIAIDCANWLSAFARYPSVNQPQRALAALSFVRKNLLTTSDSGEFYGLDGLGPVSVWNEGTGQYVAAGGPDAQTFLNTLLSQQLPNGSMPGSPDSWTTDAFGWLTPWHGIAPTAWLYFAINGLPFPPVVDTDGDGMPDWAEYVAGTDPTNPSSFLSITHVSPTPTGPSLTWTSVTNRAYYLQRASRLSNSPNFQTVESNIIGQVEQTTFTDHTGGNANGYFYRVGVQ